MKVPEADMVLMAGSRLGRRPTKRKHPFAKVGDRFVTRVVTKLLPRDATSNERVQTRCEVCGDERAAYVFNLRKSTRCSYCPRQDKA
jgi:thiamine pyrophosphate-dependent acetolactate synthase large subunit-like protein